MPWTYRVVRRVFPDTQETLVGIHEAYDKGDINEPDSITVDAVAAVSESEEGLREVLTRMLKALERPTLKWEDFPTGDKV